MKENGDDSQSHLIYIYIYTPGETGGEGEEERRRRGGGAIEKKKRFSRSVITLPDLLQRYE